MKIGRRVDFPPRIGNQIYLTAGPDSVTDNPSVRTRADKERLCPSRKARCKEQYKHREPDGIPRTLSAPWCIQVDGMVLDNAVAAAFPYYKGTVS